MSVDDKVRDEKLKYNINGEAVKISALSSGKIDKHELSCTWRNIIFWSK